MSQVIEILRLANLYRNKLVELALAYRKATLEFAKAASPEFAASVVDLEIAENDVLEIFAARKLAQQQARKRLEFDCGLADARKAEKEAKDRFFALRKKAFSHCKVEIAELLNQYYGAIKGPGGARLTSGLYWGTYLLVEQAAEGFSNLYAPDPEYHRFTGAGRLGVQLQGGLPIQDFYNGTDTQLRLCDCAVPSLQYAKKGIPLPQCTHPERYRDVWFRIGSNSKGRPIWLVIPVIWHRNNRGNHRDIPSGAVIKEASLHRWFLSGKERWTLILTCSVPADELRDSNAASSGAVGIDINYRVMRSGRQRVAHAFGDDGVMDELWLTTGMVEQWHKTRELRSKRDQMFDAIRDKLLSWIAGRTLPEWCDLSTLSRWRSSQRLSHLVYDWDRYHPNIAGDNVILDALCEWRIREELVRQHENHLREQLQDRRNDMYRVWVAKLRRKYATAYIEKMDLREAIHDVVAPKEEQEVESPQRAAASFACLSFLRGVLGESMTVVAVDPANTTLICNSCGAQSGINAARDVRHTCEKCGHEFDQDENAAKNILARGQMISKTPPPLADDGSNGLTATGRRKKRVSRSERLAAARKRRSEMALAKKLG